MTIEREGRNGPFIIQCDCCSETYECLGDEFPAAISDAISEGWFSIDRGTRFENRWRHYCGQPCAKEEDS